jgi:hypothetical protein
MLSERKVRQIFPSTNHSNADMFHWQTHGASTMHRATPQEEYSFLCNCYDKITNLQYGSMTTIQCPMLFRCNEPIFFFPVMQQTCSGLSRFIVEVSITHRHNTLGGTPLDEGSAHRRGLYLTTYNIHKGQTSMPRRNSNLQSQKASDRRSKP